MPDLLDLASEHEQEMRDDALAEQARRGSFMWPEDEGETLLCRICEEFIPEARREALPGVQTCVPCQADLERAVWYLNNNGGD